VNGRVLRCSSLLGGLLIVLAPPAPTQSRSGERICLEALEAALWRWDARSPIVPGCEVIDCCPGCPGEATLAWSVDVRGADLGAVELRLERFPAPALMALESTGGIRREGPQRFLVPIGARGAWILGMPLSSRERPPLVWPSLVLDPERGARMLAMRSDRERRAAPLEIVVEVRQHWRSMLLSTHLSIFRLVDCRPGGATPSTAADIVRLANNTAGDDAVVLLDGLRNGACANDAIELGAGDIAVGQCEETAICKGEIAVFSDDNAAVLQAAPWTSGADVVHVSMQPPVAVPLKIWLLEAAIGGLPAIDVAKAHVAMATKNYNEGHAGIAFDATYFDLSANAAAKALVGEEDDKLDDPAWVNALTSSAFFTAGMINVYYVPKAAGQAKGRNSQLERNIVMILGGFNPYTLGHEIGHAFSLEHMNDQGVSFYGNLMWEGADDQVTLTEGQCFRINFDPLSVLNVNQHRIGPVQSCPHGSADARCPEVTVDGTP
jgi:hypothetical protein